jgi:hypothetical protein
MGLTSISSLALPKGHWLVSEVWSEDSYSFTSHTRRMKAGHENVVIIRFIDGEGKALQEKTMGSGQVE